MTKPEILPEMDGRIYKPEMKFWAVLGSWGSREKKFPTAISMQVVFSTFCGQKIIFQFFKDILVSTLKSYIILSYVTYKKILKEIDIDKK